MPFSPMPVALASAGDAAAALLAGLDPKSLDSAESLSELTTVLAPLFACSPFIADYCQKKPSYLAELVNRGVLERNSENAFTVPQFQRSFESFTEATSRSAIAFMDEADLMRDLRNFRNREMIWIAIRDLLRISTVEATLARLSALAEVCIDIAEQYSYAQLVTRFGEPEDVDGKVQRLIVLAMGKLGGGELNFSSDIDLILVFPANGSTTGTRVLDNGEFFRKQAQFIVRLLSKITEQGFVFRTDLRLRPFGESGPLVMNFDGVENYYLTQGREWERYAMIKARPVCGLDEDRAELTNLLKPFVYRRYLDYSAIESLRDLKQRISAQVKQKDMYDNIKLGPGGIREIEFIGQAFQLVRGGRETELQSRSILDVLEVLNQKQLLEAGDIEALKAGYLFLRRTENYLQMMRDSQTHDLPIDESDRARLTYAMQLKTWEEFTTHLSGHRQRVETIFGSIFQLDTDVDDESVDDSKAAWLGCLNGVSAAAWLLENGFEEAETLALDMKELAGSNWYANLTTRSRQRVDEVIPLVLRVVLDLEGSRLASIGLLKLVRSVAGRSVYLQILLDTVPAMKLLGRLFSRSSWLAEFVCQHPIVIDELLDVRNLDSTPVRDQLEVEMGFILDRIREEDLDVQMDALRQYKQANTLRVAAAELENKLDLMRVSDRLSWIAEVALEAVAGLTWEQMTARFGKPVGLRDGEPYQPGFAIVAYGKLGGIELGYGSDLDLVFLHDSEGNSAHTDGARSIENQVFFARLAQKLVHFISMLTPAGVLYETDTRLRPNGQSGMLVSSVQAFGQYQQNEAWTWEHQALVRARVIVGNEHIATEFEKIRRSVLSRERQPEELRSEVATMRRRMRVELGSSDEGRFDLKQDFGGIADIEFMVQYLVLCKSVDYPELLLETDNVRLLERVESLALIKPEDARRLIDSYLGLRRGVHKLALLEKPSVVETDPERSVPHAGEKDSADKFIADLLLHRSAVREIWKQVMPDAN